jgi:signal recognition particle subunit SRP54
VSQVNALVDRFFEAKKMMSSMAGRFGLGNTRRASKNRKGKKGKVSGRGPTPPRVKGLPPGALSGMGGAGGGVPGLGPAGVPSAGQAGFPAGMPGLDQLPPGFDLSKIKLPKSK